MTEGEWEVRTVHKTDGKDGYVYFTGTKDATNAANLYRAERTAPASSG